MQTAKGAQRKEIQRVLFPKKIPFGILAPIGVKHGRLDWTKGPLTQGVHYTTVVTSQARNCSFRHDIPLYEHCDLRKLGSNVFLVFCAQMVGFTILFRQQTDE
jgi:hypothetical protein